MEAYMIFSLIMPLLIAGAVLFFVFRNRGEKAENAGKDAYYYVISFILVMVLYWAVADLFRIILEQVLGVGAAASRYSYSYSSGTGSQENLLRGVSLRLSTILVGFPIWAFHWYKASKKPKEEMDYHSRKSYAFVIMVMTSFGVIGTGIGLVYQTMNAVLGVGQNISESMAYLLPYALAGAGVWIGHYLVWKEAKGANTVISAPV
jgi:hypothetical protein